MAPPVRPMTEDLLELPDTGTTRDLLAGALEELDSAAAPSPPPPEEEWVSSRPYVFLPQAEEASERRVAPRIPLTVGADLMLPGDPEVRRIRVTSASVQALFLVSPVVPDIDTPVVLELEVLGSYARRLEGKVVRTTAAGFAVELDPAAAETQPYWAAFLELARQAGLQNPKLRIEVAPPPAPGDESSAQDLSLAWTRVLAEPSDDGRNQAFIHACMRAEKLNFAVDCYRSRLRGGDPQAERYLEQLGTILGFYTLRRRQAETNARPAAGTHPLKGWLALAFALVFAVAMARFLTEPGDATWAEDRLDEPPSLRDTKWNFGD